MRHHRTHTKAGEAIILSKSPAGQTPVGVHRRLPASAGRIEPQRSATLCQNPILQGGPWKTSLTGRWARISSPARHALCTLSRDPETGMSPQPALACRALPIVTNHLKRPSISFEIRAISADKVPGVDVPDCRPGPSVNSQIRWKGRVSLSSPMPCAGTTHHGKRRRWCDERSAGPDTSGGRHDPAGEAQRQHPRRALLTRRGCRSQGTPVRQSGERPGSMHR